MEHVTLPPGFIQTLTVLLIAFGNRFFGHSGFLVFRCIQSLSSYYCPMFLYVKQSYFLMLGKMGHSHEA